ncbi:MAG: DUF1957 domain-containing protein [Verrucomicrobiae bacterium]|nr:DUF1957 domain-containing protein [Verrucomicrobiae bacterium]
MKPPGLILLLHAHLPFVRHPGFSVFHEESWFFEAVLECYLPLLEVLNGWERDGVPGALTLSVSPTLAAMWEDPLLRRRLRAHLDNVLSLARKEEIRAHLLPERRAVARWLLERLERRASDLDGPGAALARAFGHHAAAGRLELITCPATHPTLPLLVDEPGSIRLQLRTALDAHNRLFGSPPAGLWLPECAWCPEIERPLLAAGIRWTVLETHGLGQATPPPRRGIFAPVLTGGGLAVFGRDPCSARQVWSRHGGYPGDPRYREFHRDVGHEADREYLEPHRHGALEPGFTGLKFHRITGPGPVKALYDRPAALDAVRTHAAHFIGQRARMLQEAARHLDRPPVLMAPYDAELFGHWWFEGPEFLDAVARCAYHPESGLRLTTPSQVLKAGDPMECVTPAASTWGDGGHFRVWLHPENAWMEVPVRNLGRRLVALASRRSGMPETALGGRRLRQAARELMLAQASDWPFLLAMGTAGDYPARRFRDHVAAAGALAEAVEADAPDDGRDGLSARETQYNLFPGVQWRHLAARG